MPIFFCDHHMNLLIHDATCLMTPGAMVKQAVPMSNLNLATTIFRNPFAVHATRIVRMCPSDWVQKFPSAPSKRRGRRHKCWKHLHPFRAFFWRKNRRWQPEGVIDGQVACHFCLAALWKYWDKHEFRPVSCAGLWFCKAGNANWRWVTLTYTVTNFVRGTCFACATFVFPQGMHFWFMSCFFEGMMDSSYWKKWKSLSIIEERSQWLWVW